MNAITTYQPTPAPSFTFSDMERMATSFARGGMFGSSDPHAVLSLMLVAQAEGKHPAQIMQDYHVISGKPAKKADAMLRDFLASGGSVEWHQLDDDKADATFSHPAGGSARITWDDDRVKQAELGGNKMHKKFPRQMKRSRTVSEGVRTVFPGATGGFYVPEEVADFDDKPAPKAVRARDLTPEPLALTDAPYTIDDARRDMKEAADLRALRDVWQRSKMGPHRDDLKAELEARKFEMATNPAATEGPDDSQRGETHEEDGR